MQNPIEIIQREHEKFLVYRTGLHKVGRIEINGTKEIKLICSKCAEDYRNCKQTTPARTGTSAGCKEFTLSKREEDAL